MKSARFFCESCGRAVPFNADMCPHCGKKFDAVKCPVCKYTGMAGEFIKGCPACGYLASDDSEQTSPQFSRGGMREAAKRPGGGEKVPRVPDRAPKYMKAPRHERDVELFSDSSPEEKRAFHSWSYYLILVLLFGILISMGIFLIMIM